MSDFELAVIAPPQDLVVHSVVTKKHTEIGEEFLARVRNLIGHVPGKITTYAVKRAEASWDTDQETITLEYPEGQKLSITLHTKQKLDS